MTKKDYEYSINTLQNIMYDLEVLQIEIKGIDAEGFITQALTPIDMLIDQLENEMPEDEEE